jgi:hypothetical protein
MRYAARGSLARTERLFVAAYTSAAFQKVREALLACSNADRTFLRRWIVKWIDERGHVLRDAEPLPDRGCDGRP